MNANDQTVPGGAYLVDGKLVNSEGKALEGEALKAAETELGIKPAETKDDKPVETPKNPR